MAKIIKIIRKNRLTVAISCLSIIVFIASAATTLEEKRINKLWEIHRGKTSRLEKLVELSIQYPDYRDLLYNLAISQSELGNNDAAKEALDRAKYLDPNNETLIKIADTLAISLSTN